MGWWGRIGWWELLGGALLRGRNLTLGLSVSQLHVKPSRRCLCGQPGTHWAHGAGLGVEGQEETGEGWSRQNT